MPSLTSQQKSAVSQLISLTGLPDRLALRFLKNTNFNVEAGYQAYRNTPGLQDTYTPDGPSLDKLFESLRDSEDSKDVIGVDSMMKYLEALGVNPESCEIFIVLDIVHATGFGQITRKSYVEGWAATGVVPATTAAQSRYVRKCSAALADNVSYFRQIYRQTFIAGKEETHKALPLENALIYWDMIFTPPGRPWASRNKQWLPIWKEFLQAKWTRSVNKDMWNQTLEFALRSMEDDTLSFWREDGAWPSVIDDFVVYCRQQNYVPTPSDGGAIETK